MNPKTIIVCTKETVEPLKNQIKTGILDLIADTNVDSLKIGKLFSTLETASILKLHNEDLTVVLSFGDLLTAKKKWDKSMSDEDRALGFED